VRVCDRIRDDAIVRGSFSQVKTLARLSKSFISRGRFVFAVDRGILWELDTPFASTTIITGDRLVQRDPDGKTSILDGSANPMFRRFAETLQAVFAGNLAVIEEQFDLYFEGQAETQWRLGLVPKDATVRGVIASLEISGDTHLREVLLTEADQDTVRYTFTDIQSAGALTPDEARLFF
jgi:outer membrane lipoprotein-sorting protein